MSTDKQAVLHFEFNDSTFQNLAQTRLQQYGSANETRYQTINSFVTNNRNEYTQLKSALLQAVDQDYLAWTKKNPETKERYRGSKQAQIDQLTFVKKQVRQALDNGKTPEQINQMLWTLDTMYYGLGMPLPGGPYYKKETLPNHPEDFKYDLVSFKYSEQITIGINCTKAKEDEGPNMVHWWTEQGVADKREKVLYQGSFWDFSCPVYKEVGGKQVAIVGEGNPVLDDDVKATNTQSFLVNNSVPQQTYQVSVGTTAIHSANVLTQRFGVANPGPTAAISQTDEQLRRECWVAWKTRKQNYGRYFQDAKDKYDLAAEILDTSRGTDWQEEREKELKQAKAALEKAQDQGHYLRIGQYNFIKKKVREALAAKQTPEQINQMLQELDGIYKEFGCPLPGVPKYRKTTVWRDAQDVDGLDNGHYIDPEVKSDAVEFQSTIEKPDGTKQQVMIGIDCNPPETYPIPGFGGTDPEYWWKETIDIKEEAKFYLKNVAYYRGFTASDPYHTMEGSVSREKLENVITIPSFNQPLSFSDDPVETPQNTMEVVWHTVPKVNQVKAVPLQQLTGIYTQYRKPPVAAPQYVELAYTKPAYTQPAYTKPAYTKPAYTKTQSAVPPVAQQKLAPPANINMFYTYPSVKGIQMPVAYQSVAYQKNGARGGYTTVYQPPANVGKGAYQPSPARYSVKK